MSRTTRLAALAAIPLTVLAICAAAQSAAPAPAPGTRPDFFAHMLETIDSNHDGRISLDEFVAAAGARFKSLDTRNKGSIDAADIAASPEAVARIDHRAEAIVKHFDTAGNGYVTKDEFLAAAQDRFTRIDINADGKLTPDEMAAPRGQHGNKSAKGGGGFAQKRFDKLDTNHDGVVSKDEYLAAAAAKFAQFDAAGDGKVTAAEIETSPKTQDRAVRGAERLVRHMDTNGDGVVSQDEYVAAAKARFARLDKNGDGFIDADEAKNARRWAGTNHGPGHG